MTEGMLEMPKGRQGTRREGDGNSPISARSFPIVEKGSTVSPALAGDGVPPTAGARGLAQAAGGRERPGLAQAAGGPQSRGSAGGRKHRNAERREPGRGAGSSDPTC